MAAGERSKSGKPKDYVKHAGKINGSPVCDTENFGYVDMQWVDVTCKRCMKLIQKGYKI